MSTNKFEYRCSCGTEIARWDEMCNRFHEMEELKTEIKRLREALEFYAHESRYYQDYTTKHFDGREILDDSGLRARWALEGEENHE